MQPRLTPNKQLHALPAHSAHHPYRGYCAIDNDPIGNFRKALHDRVGDKRATALAAAFDRKFPGQGEAVLRHFLAQADPVGSFCDTGLQVLCEAAEPRNPRDAGAEAAADTAASVYDAWREEQREARRKAKGR
jgi:hypothetical protein